MAQRDMAWWAGRGVGAVLVALVVGHAPAAAQGLESVSLAFDNDGLNFWVPPSRRTDRFYTHGARLEAVLGWSPPGTDRLFPGDLPPCGGPTGSGPCVRTRFRLAQRIYTPEDVFFYDPDGGDHPYGGWLSATMAAERVSPGRTTTLAVEIGVTGSPSLAERAHLAFHEWLDKHPPRGWEHQLPFELGGSVSYRDARRWPEGAADTREPSFFGQTHWGGTLGTIRTSAGAGMSVGFGWGAPVDGVGSGPPPEGPYVLVVLGAEGAVVARDVFLDGSLWHDSNSTVRKPLVGRARFRIRTGVRGLGLEFGVTRSTREFRDQGTPHTFSTLKLVIGG